MKRYLHSTYIKKSSIDPAVNKKIEDDLILFNRMRVKGYAMKDRHADLGISFHLWLKSEYGVNDYFATAVTGSIEMTRSSQEKLLAMYISDTEDDIADMEKRIGELTAVRESLLAMKASLIAYRKAGSSDLSLIRNFKSSDISFKDNGMVMVGPPKHGTVYPDLWSFEHFYLEPKVKRLRSAIINIKAAIRRREHKIKTFTEMLDTGTYRIAFGGHKLLSNREMPPEHRARLLKAKRCGRMTLSGRKDALGGNFMVRYDPKTYTVSYKGSSSKEFLSVGEVKFPYGQELVDEYTSVSGAPAAWTVVDCGNAWRFDVCLTLPDPAADDDAFSDGCIAADINSDRIAVADLNESGLPISRRVIPLDLSGSAGNNKAAISAVLDSIFMECRLKNKPLAMEDIGNVKRKAGRYSKEANRNRGISMFASATIRQLAESKAFKYNVGVRFINPAYTSQTGKIKYMKRFGMSIHESAALVIGRRAMGYTDRLPGELRAKLTKKQKRLPRLKQWKAAYKYTKSLSRVNIINTRNSNTIIKPDKNIDAEMLVFA